MISKPSKPNFPINEKGKGVISRICFIYTSVSQLSINCSPILMDDPLSNTIIIYFWDFDAKPILHNYKSYKLPRISTFIDIWQYPFVALAKLKLMPFYCSLSYIHHIRMWVSRPIFFISHSMRYIFLSCVKHVHSKSMFWFALYDYALCSFL